MQIMFFKNFIDDDTNYLFADMLIAQGNSMNWSYPTWPSHLDHILITNELFADFQNFNSHVSVIRIDNYMGGGIIMKIMFLIIDQLV